MIVGGQVAIMFLNRGHFVTEPDGDFVDAFAGGNQKTREGVPHGMRRNPVASLLAHIFHEGRAKIVSIKPFAVGHVGPEHEWVAKSVRLRNV